MRVRTQTASKIIGTGRKARCRNACSTTLKGYQVARHPRTQWSKAAPAECTSL